MDDKDPPIVEQDWIAGIRVVDFGNYRVARGLSRRPTTSCKHNNVVYDEKERRIWCKDCETTIEPFDAYIRILNSYNSAVAVLNYRENKILELENYNLVRIASKNIDQAWRKKESIPCCPNCARGLLPSDFNPIISRTNKQLEIKRRKKE